MAQGPHIRLSRGIRGKLRALGLRQHGVGVVAQTAQGTFVVDPRDFGVGRALLERGAYDQDVIAQLLQQVTAQSTVVVVGAHVGALVVPIASEVAQVIAMEPNPATYALLSMNLRLNALSNVQALPWAAADEPGHVVISHNTQNTGGSAVQKADAAAQGVVECVRLDDVVDVPAVDLMVVDAEGYEVNVFRGAQHTLALTGCVYTEFSPRALARAGHTVDDFFAAIPQKFQTLTHHSRGQIRCFARAEWKDYVMALDTPERLLLNFYLSA